MAEKTKAPMREPLGKPRQIRLTKSVEEELEKIAAANGIEWVQAVRMCARMGMPILKRRLGDALKQAA